MATPVHAPATEAAPAAGTKSAWDWLAEFGAGAGAVKARLAGPLRHYAAPLNSALSLQQLAACSRSMRTYPHSIGQETAFPLATVEALAGWGVPANAPVWAALRPGLHLQLGTPFGAHCLLDTVHGVLRPPGRGHAWGPRPVRRCRRTVGTLLAVAAAGAPPPGPARFAHTGLHAAHAMHTLWSSCGEVQGRVSAAAASARGALVAAAGPGTGPTAQLTLHLATFAVAVDDTELLLQLLPALQQHPDVQAADGQRRLTVILLELAGSHGARHILQAALAGALWQPLPATGAAAAYSAAAECGQLPTVQLLAGVSGASGLAAATAAERPPRNVGNAALRALACGSLETAQYILTTPSTAALTVPLTEKDRDNGMEPQELLAVCPCAWSVAGMEWFLEGGGMGALLPPPAAEGTDPREAHAALCQRLFMTACSTGHAALVQWFLAPHRATPVSPVDDVEEGATPRSLALSNAVRGGSADAVALLLEQGGASVVPLAPLHWDRACADGAVEVVALLLEQSEERAVPTHGAAGSVHSGAATALQGGQGAVCDLLLSLGGDRALHWPAVMAAVLGPEGGAAQQALEEEEEEDAAADEGEVVPEAPAVPAEATAEERAALLEAHRREMAEVALEKARPKGRREPASLRALRAVWSDVVLPRRMWSVVRAWAAASMAAPSKSWALSPCDWERAVAAAAGAGALSLMQELLAGAASCGVSLTLRPALQAAVAGGDLDAVAWFLATYPAGVPLATAPAAPAALCSSSAWEAAHRAAHGIAQAVVGHGQNAASQALACLAIRWQSDYSAAAHSCGAPQDVAALVLDVTGEHAGELVDFNFHTLRSAFSEGSALPAALLARRGTAADRVPWAQLWTSPHTGDGPAPLQEHLLAETLAEPPSLARVGLALAALRPAGGNSGWSGAGTLARQCTLAGMLTAETLHCMNRCQPDCLEEWFLHFYPIAEAQADSADVAIHDRVQALGRILGMVEQTPDMPEAGYYLVALAALAVRLVAGADPVAWATARALGLPVEHLRRGALNEDGAMPQAVFRHCPVEGGGADGGESEETAPLALAQGDSLPPDSELEVAEAGTMGPVLTPELVQGLLQLAAASDAPREEGCEEPRGFTPLATVLVRLLKAHPAALTPEPPRPSEEEGSDEEGEEAGWSGVVVDATTLAAAALGEWSIRRAPTLSRRARRAARKAGSARGAGGAEAALEPAPAPTPVAVGDAGASGVCAVQ